MINPKSIQLKYKTNFDKLLLRLDNCTQKEIDQVFNEYKKTYCKEVIIKLIRLSIAYNRSGKIKVDFNWDYLLDYLMINE